MSPIGAGNRGVDEAAICPSVVPVALAQNWLEKKAVKSIFGLPRECTIADIDDVIGSFVVRTVSVIGGAQLTFTIDWSASCFACWIRWMSDCQSSGSV